MFSDHKEKRIKKKKNILNKNHETFIWIKNIHLYNNPQINGQNIDQKNVHYKKSDLYTLYIRHTFL